LNGSVALKFVIGQPQRRASVATDAFSACSEPLFKATGAFDKLWKNLSCGLEKETPRPCQMKAIIRIADKSPFPLIYQLIYHILDVSKSNLSERKSLSLHLDSGIL
jgi:hypothetical protein